MWICRDPAGHLQATGFDSAERKQYLYHPDWTAWRSRAKFEGLGAFGASLARFRDRVRRDLEGEAGDLEVSLAADGRFVSGHIHSARQENRGVPVPDPTSAALEKVRALSKADFPASSPKFTDDGNILPN